MGFATSGRFMWRQEPDPRYEAPRRADLSNFDLRTDGTRQKIKAWITRDETAENRSGAGGGDSSGTVAKLEGGQSAYGLLRDRLH